jgi:predicted TIM-barrel fold metal-dependent hydrolase
MFGAEIRFLLRTSAEVARPLMTVIAKVSETETKTEISAAEATEEASEEFETTLKNTLKSVQEAWDKADDKLAISGLGFAALLVLWASTGLINAIDKLPLIPAVFEFVGILFSGVRTFPFAILCITYL